MSYNFNADEIFLIAEKIEQNGAAFYRKAAGQISDKQHRQFLLDLALMEDDHLKIFNSMRKVLNEREKETTVFDPDDDAILYLRAFADVHVFDIKVNPSEYLESKRTIQEVLKKAIQLEKDSIVFYLGIKDMVPEHLGKDKVDDIIKEEKKHIALLSQKLLE